MRRPSPRNLAVVGVLAVAAFFAGPNTAAAADRAPGTGPSCPVLADDGLRMTESCSECHAIPYYERGAHGDSVTGVFRLPDEPRGDCLHCHEMNFDWPYLFLPYQTVEEKRAFCLYCHDGNTAPAPGPPTGGHAEGSPLLCTGCHDHHIPVSHGGGNGSGCEPCHGHDEGYEYAEGLFSEGAGTSIGHSTHTENDADDLRGPLLECGDCHDTQNYPFFKSGSGSPPYGLSETDVCDNCHSPDGAFDGLDDQEIGARQGNGGEPGHNWRYGVYADSLFLAAGMELWCAGCHDDAPAYSRQDSVGGVYAPDMLGDDSTYGYFINGHGRPAASGSYPRMNWQAFEENGNPAADVGGCTRCHAGEPAEAHLDHMAGTSPRLPAGHGNDQDNSSCNQCHPPGDEATADPRFYVDSGSFEAGAHGGTLCTVCHDVHGLGGAYPAMTVADKEDLCGQCHGGHEAHAAGIHFGRGGKTYSLECTSCHNIHTITGMFSNSNPDKSPLSLPSDITNVWGDEPGEKMEDYAGSGTYRTPKSDSLSGSVLPDYPTFCLDCHGEPVAEFGPHGDIGWTGDPHGLNSANIPNGGGTVPDWYGCGKGEGWDGDENLEDTWPVLPRGRGEQIFSRQPFDQEERIGGANFVTSCTDCHVTHEAGIGSKLKGTVNGGPGSVIWNTMCNNCHYYYSDWHAGMSCGNASCHVANSIHRMSNNTGAGGTRAFDHDLVVDMKFDNNLNDSGTWRMHGVGRVAAGSYATGRFDGCIEVSDHPVEVGTRNSYWSTDEGHHGTWKYTEMKHHMTLEAWVYPTVDTGERKILAKHTYTDGGYALVLKELGGALRAGLLTNVNGGGEVGVWDAEDCNGLRGAFSSVPLPLNEWSHVAATYDSALPDRDSTDVTVGRIRIYLNGEDVTTGYPEESTCWAQPGAGENAMFPFSDHNDDPVGVCYEDHWCASALSVGGMNWSDPNGNFVGRLDEVKIWNVTKDSAYFETADSQCPPRIAEAEGMFGSDELLVTFSEGVWANPGMAGALEPSDFVLTDNDDGRTITGVVHVPGAEEATLTLSSPLDAVDDILVDELSTAPGAMFDEYDNGAGIDGVVIRLRTGCPEGEAAFELNEAAGSPYVLDDGRTMAGTVNDPSETLPGDGLFHGDGVDNYIDFTTNVSCLKASTALTIETMIKPSGMEGSGAYIKRVLARDQGGNYQVSVWRDNSWENYEAPDGTASIALWVAVVDNHGGNGWKPVLTDCVQYPIVSDHWYHIRIIWNSEKAGGIPGEIWVDDLGPEGDDGGENWAGLADATDSDQSQLTPDRYLYEGDEIRTSDGAFTIGANVNNHANNVFLGLIDYVRVGGMEALPLCQLLPDTLDFGAVPVGDTAEASWSIVNAGTADLEGDITESCDDFEIVSGGGPFLLGQGEELVVAVRFAPTEVGVRTCAIATGAAGCSVFPCTGIGDYSTTVASEAPGAVTFGLEANRPNPFNPSTEIAFHIAGRGFVELTVYGIEGRLVRRLVQAELESGAHRVVWDGTDGQGKPVPSGIYFCQLKAGSEIGTRRMTLLR
ncbi:MAG: LamG-like jellyroll fold domain-containing protein [Candidatus Eisenbacteria bacterium]